MNISRRFDLLNFLRNATKTANPWHFPSSTPSSSARQYIYVLGNPSADLDSIISAIVYSYFATREHNFHEDRKKSAAAVARQYIPVINLPDVPSGKELRRLRPEFMTALRLAVSDSDNATFSPLNGDEDVESQMLKESIVTVHDLRERLLRGPAESGGRVQLDVMMVDWNALPNLSTGRGIYGLSDVYPDLNISVTGCIDHHEDESFIPESSALPQHDPRCIQTGVGSCTSLVVRELRFRGLWPGINGGPEVPNIPAQQDANSSTREQDLSRVYETQAAKLALAAILIDTADMTAEGKVSDTDREAVSFLEAKIKEGQGAANWDRKAFYEEIARAKDNSVENLTVEEILGRDYKDWTDAKKEKEMKGTATVKIGICNVVKPLSWLLHKISSQEGEDGNYSDEHAQESLYGHLCSFGADRNLDVIALMTVYNSPNAGFQRELLVYVLNRELEEVARRFEDRATKEFGLEGWADEGATKASVSDGGNPKDGYRRVWRQTDVSKSRKQVAPLLRKSFAGE